MSVRTILNRTILPLGCAVPLLYWNPAGAGDLPEYVLVLRNHQYVPSELHVPAGTRFRITVRNEDPTAEEFESTDFGREKIVLPKATITVFVGPLKAGTYGFFGDFHSDTAQGRLIVE
ncbi:MAG TPA: cupredoxin domain-containing protein [Steroidobacteraceae bacterium]|nr:cupredoxin domain-containing protein [Steroidobacteraceae bacterium]